MSKIRCKPGVTPMNLWILSALSWIPLPDGVDAYVVTAGTNGQHKDGSKHATFEALDIRTKDFPDRESKLALVRALLRGLGDGDYDVIFEHEGQPNEHVHVEFDPHG